MKAEDEQVVMQGSPKCRTINLEQEWTNEQVTGEKEVCVDYKETGKTGLCCVLAKGFECQVAYLALLGQCGSFGYKVTIN